MAPRLITDQMLELFRLDFIDRAPGRHVSTAIYNIMRSLHPDRFDDSPIDRVRANLGNALEAALIVALDREYPNRYFKPGEITYRGISGTPDLLDMWGGGTEMVEYDEWATVEVKLTWASARRAEDLEDVWWWRYWRQGEAYAEMLGLHKVIVMPIFINGGWEGGKPGTPCGHEWMDEFSDEHSKENWQMIELYA